MGGYKYVLMLHVLGATVWTGGHLVLALTVLPRALRERSVEVIQQFEQGYERVGIPALIIQVLTGLHLAAKVMPGFSNWFDLSQPISRLICLKLGLLGCTMLLAIHARLRIIPRLTEASLGFLAWHIAGVTLLSVAFVVVGVSFRFGGF